MKTILRARPKFNPGRCSVTRHALEAMDRSGQDPGFFLDKHLRIDQGECDGGDHALNLAAVTNGERIFTAFKTLLGVKLWIITEADRSRTTIMLPEEY